MAENQPSAKPPTGPLVSMAAIGMYERLLAAKEDKIARMQAEIEQLAEERRSWEAELRQAHELIAYLSERVDGLAALPSPASEEKVTTPLASAVPPLAPQERPTARASPPQKTPWHRLGT